MLLVLLLFFRTQPFCVTYSGKGIFVSREKFSEFLVLDATEGKCKRYSIKMQYFLRPFLKSVASIQIYLWTEHQIRCLRKLEILPFPALP